MQHPDADQPQGRTEPRSRGQIGAGAGGARVLILGAILAGGRSRRFGSDKATAPFEGKPLIEHVRALVAGRVDAVVVIGRPGGIADLPRPDLGPLGGIAGAIDHAATHGFDTVLTIGCDMPRLPATLLDALLHRAPSYCADAPVLGHWPAALGAQLLAHIDASDRRSVRGWAETIGALPIAAPTPLANVNTPDDLLAL
ncbi:molybdenum cofactor guanylyltransferase [Sphingomonas sp. A2-49]|uniref:molybdenum cofactor guanylyltransferase n=1 Tax=Sphingomonas sp. A2-49 TaxID=1391375 RepID=UPI0021D08574|nr:molybdenum cofactor guanylyltransferase [Sphingomonas sp. A2-49]MCU6455447.1 molybdenum cofactor guanylyltransferase [Sphingomonas sp. A2-49]